MGLSNFPSASEGVLPVLVMNTVLSVALLKNMVRSVLQVVGGSTGNTENIEEEDSDGWPAENARETPCRRVSVTQFKCLCLCDNNNKNHRETRSTRNNYMECCVCLCGYEADEEVSLLSCKHFFHKCCLEKWFDNKQTTCPLCRSND